MEFIWILVGWLFPRDAVRQVAMATHAWISKLIDWIEDEDCWLHLHEDAQACIDFESNLIVAEDMIRMVIEGRARQIAGIRHYTPYRPRVHVPVRARTPVELFHILARVAAFHDNIEAYAQRRAERLMRERERNPLGLAETVAEYFARSCGPVKAGAGAVAAPSPQDWGRWTGASSRRDGGGSLHVRGPP